MRVALCVTLLALSLSLFPLFLLFPLFSFLSTNSTTGARSLEQLVDMDRVLAALPLSRVEILPLLDVDNLSCRPNPVDDDADLDFFKCKCVFFERPSTLILLF